MIDNTDFMTQPTTHTPGLVARLGGSLLLALVSLRRALRWRQTLVASMLLTFAALAVTAWSLRHPVSTRDFIQHILLPMYVSFLMPIFCLCYAAPSIAVDREERTLVYLLATGLPRPMIFTAKYLSALVLAMAWTLGSLGLLCSLAGASGRVLFQPLCWAVCWSTVAYVSLFHLFSVLFRRSTIIALLYTLFLETFLGNMPGIVKRGSLSFYTQCLILDAAEQLGIDPGKLRPLALFLPVPADTALTVLYVVGGVLFLAGALLFSRLEYA
jgi:ABC-type transport system involved in multi-copper enzyme maturation permease subunit